MTPAHCWLPNGVTRGLARPTCSRTGTSDVIDPLGRFRKVATPGTFFTFRGTVAQEECRALARNLRGAATIAP